MKKENPVSISLKDTWENEFIKLFKSANEIGIISPYITNRNIIEKYFSKDSKRIRVITRANNEDFICKASKLEILEKLIEKKIEVKVISKNLHSKLYLFDNKKVIITSANFTSKGLTGNLEYGILTSQNEIVDDVKKYFGELWKKGNILDKDIIEEIRANVKQEEDKIRKNKNVVPRDWGKKIERITKNNRALKNKFAGWFKVSGSREKKGKVSPMTIDSIVNTGMINTKKGRNGKGKPKMKEDDVIILSRMSFNNKEDKSDHIIYGRAKVDKPYEEKNNLLNYKKFIDRDKEKAYDKIDRWPFSIWIKDLEVIGNPKGFIYLSELNKNGDEIIKSTSLSQQSHIKIDHQKMKKINTELEKRFKIFKKEKNDVPQKAWINDYISNRKKWIKNIKKKS